MMQALPEVIRDNLSGILQFVTTGLVVWVWWSLRRIFVNITVFFQHAKHSLRLILIHFASKRYHFNFHFVLPFF